MSPYILQVGIDETYRFLTIWLIVPVGGDGIDSVCFQYIQLSRFESERVFKTKTNRLSFKAYA